MACARSLVDDCSHPSSCPRFLQVCVRPYQRQTFLSTAGECRLHELQTDKFISFDWQGGTNVLLILPRTFLSRAKHSGRESCNNMKKLAYAARAFYRSMEMPLWKNGDIFHCKNNRSAWQLGMKRVIFAYSQQLHNLWTWWEQVKPCDYPLFNYNFI